MAHRDAQQAHLPLEFAAGVAKKQMQADEQTLPQRQAFVLQLGDETAGFLARYERAQFVDPLDDLELLPRLAEPVFLQTQA